MRNRSPMNQARRGRRTARPVLENLEPRELLAAFVVTDLGDSGPGTLRAAVEQADMSPDMDIIAFAPGLTGTITLKSALPDLSSSVAIFGPGSSKLTVTRDPAATDPFRILTIDAGALVGLNDLTISGGLANFYGGGIANAGTLIVERSAITNNVASLPPDFTIPNYADLYHGPAGGAGIYNSGSLGLIDSLVAGNVASSLGLVGFLATLIPPTPGGGIENQGGAIIVNSTIGGNWASDGGGIDNNGPLTLLNSTIGGNHSLNPQFGAGSIVNDGALLTIAFSTITANNSNRGGGIYDAPPPIGTVHPGPTGVLLIDSIVVGNTLGSDAKPSDFEGLPLPGSTNDLIGVMKDHENQMIGGSGPNFDARLGPLGNNGGPTPTYPLLPRSPALDAGIAIPGVTSDQRGVARPQGRAPDIGAFEAVGRRRRS